VGSAANLIGGDASEITGAAYEAQRKLNDVSNLTGSDDSAGKHSSIYFRFKNNVVDSVNF
jgi:hypothetical protein